MYVGRWPEDVRVEDVNQEGRQLDKVELFTYLGSVVTTDGKTTWDIVKKGPI